MDFMSVLNTVASEVEKPLPLPAGNYLLKVSKVPTEKSSSNGDWMMIDFPVVPVEAQNDVDPDQLAEFGDLKSGAGRVSFMFPTADSEENARKRSLFQLKKFLQDTLMIEADPDATIKELMAKAVGHECLATARHRMVDGETFVDFINTMPAQAD